MESNITNLSFVSPNSETDQPKIVWNRYTTGKVLTMLTLTAIFASDLIAFIILQKTRRIPFATKWLTSLTLVFDCTYQLVVILTPPMTYVEDEDGVIAMVWTEIGRLALALSWVAVTLMISERFICLRWPNFYARNAFDSRVRLITVTCLFSVVVVKLTLRILVIPYACSESITTANITKDRPILPLILALCLIIGLVCYLGIIVIVRKQIRSVDVRYSRTGRGVLRTYKATQTVWIIFLVFFAVHIPLLGIYMHKYITNHTEDIRFHLFIFSVIMCVVNPAMYAWRFKECRYIVIAAMSKRCKCYENRVRTMKCEIYNIVVLETSRLETFERDVCLQNLRRDSANIDVVSSSI